MINVFSIILILKKKYLDPTFSFWKEPKSMHQWKRGFFPKTVTQAICIGFSIVHFKNIYTSDSTWSRTCCINFVFPRKSFFIICSLTFCTKCSLQLSDSVQVNLQFVWPLCVFMLQVQMQVCTQQQLDALDRRLKLRTSTLCKNVHMYVQCTGIEKLFLFQDPMSPSNTWKSKLEMASIFAI